MKNLLKTFSLMLVSLLIFTACNSSGGEKAEVEKPAVEADAETKLAVEGMMCMKGCVGLITKKLDKMHGVGDFEINFDEAYAEINYDSKQVSEGDIIAMINSLADEAYKAYPYSEVESAEEEVDIEVEVDEDKGSHLMKP